MVNISENVNKLRSELTKSSSQDITIIGVTKRFGPEVYKEAMAAGILHFGENRAQEVRDKANAIPDDCSLHFIAPIQSNKLKYLKGVTASFDALDNLETAAKLNQADVPKDEKLKVLIQVQDQESGNKSGIDINRKDDIYKLIDYCLKSKHLELEGFMCMGPTPTASQTISKMEHENQVRQAFAQTALLYADTQAKLGIKLTRLSMGMSDDFHIALQEGSNEIRLGSRIFGLRPAS